MKGTIALVGAGEFLPSMEAVDRGLLLASGGNRVVVLPTASALDGPGVPERWGRMGVEHFQQLGAQAEAILALDRAACEGTQFSDRVRMASLAYFSGGKPDYLYQTLVGSKVWQAVTEILGRGGVLAGCSAGAMILGSHLPSLTVGRGSPVIRGWRPAFGLLPRCVVIPHFNQAPEWLMRLFLPLRPEGTTVLGIDADTALIGHEDTWTVRGSGRVSHFAETIRRYRDGDTVPL
ncbi:MAG: Type 1 glutamine amidotransferase-like domain-containing protein [Anaerolineales bacterium]